MTILSHEPGFVGLVLELVGTVSVHWVRRHAGSATSIPVRQRAKTV